MFWQLKNMYCQVDQRVLLDGLNIDFNFSTSLAVVGASGAGKSIGLQCALGLFPFQKGTVAFSDGDQQLSSPRPPPLPTGNENASCSFRSFPISSTTSTLKPICFSLFVSAHMPKTLLKVRSLRRSLTVLVLHHNLKLIPALFLRDSANRSPLPEPCYSNPKF